MRRPRTADSLNYFLLVSAAIICIFHLAGIDVAGVCVGVGGGWWLTLCGLKQFVIWRTERWRRALAPISALIRYMGSENGVDGG